MRDGQRHREQDVVAELRQEQDGRGHAQRHQHAEALLQAQRLRQMNTISSTIQTSRMFSEDHRTSEGKVAAHRAEALRDFLAARHGQRDLVGEGTVKAPASAFSSLGSSDHSPSAQ